MTSKRVLFIVVTTVLSAIYVTPDQVDQGLIETLMHQVDDELTRDQGSEQPLNPIDKFLLDIAPQFIGQEANDENGTKWKNKQYAMQDTSNDDAARLSLTQLITRSGFKYEIHEAVAEDGYITQMTRVINPLADPVYLRTPPIIMEHGGTIDPTCYVIASSIQHHPEKWPRRVRDGPITSWNRSLAFVLANNGFDVWLAEGRGSSDSNRKHNMTIAAKNFRSDRNKYNNMTQGENVNELLHQWNYWGFSQDDIIAHEYKSHIDAVLKATGAQKVSMMTFSLSTPTSLAFFSIRPDYAEKVHGYICMAPIVSGEGVSAITKLFFQSVCPFIPDALGTLVLTDLLLTQPIRELLIILSKPKVIRYSMVKMIITLAMGPSAKWQTLIDLNVLGHLLRRVSFREAKQFCQQVATNRLQKFDYGPIKNQLIYNQTDPPIYDYSDLHIKDWIIVSAANDKISTPQNTDHLLGMVSPKPIAHILAPGFDHLDLIAGFGNDKYVNLPILAYLENISPKPFYQ